MKTELMKGTTLASLDMIRYPVIVEEKIDGIRCHVRVLGGKVTYMSYAGKPLANLSSLDKTFMYLRGGFDVAEFDVEIMYRESFAETYSLCRSKSLPADFQVMSLKAYLLDLPTMRRVLEERVNFMDNMERYADGVIKRPRSILAQSKADVEWFYEGVVSGGGEGVMLKDPRGWYLNGSRSNIWQKWKREETVDAQVKGVLAAVAADGGLHDWAGALYVQCEDGTKANASLSKFTMKQRKEIMADADKLVGQWVEVRYMQKDRAGGLRHPVALRFREDKQ